MVSPSQKHPYTKTLGEAEGKIAESLILGHAPSVASAIMQLKTLKEAVFTYILQELCNECSRLYQKTAGASPFRKIPVTA